MREDLLAGATRVLDRDGAAGFTTNRVADATGVSIGSLYQYYPNKGALLSELHETQAQTLWHKLEAILLDSSRPPLERFEDVVQRTFAVQAEAREQHLALYEAGIAPGESEQLAELAAHARVAFTRFLSEETRLHEQEAQERAAHCVEVLFALLEQTAKSSESSTKLAAHTARMLSLYLGLEPISLASSGKVGEGPAP